MNRSYFIYLFIKIYLYTITYSVVQNTLFYNMVLLRLVKQKPQHGIAIVATVTINTTKFYSKTLSYRLPDHCRSFPDRADFQDVSTMLPRLHEPTMPLSTTFHIVEIGTARSAQCDLGFTQAGWYGLEGFEFLVAGQLCVQNVTHACLFAKCTTPVQYI